MAQAGEDGVKVKGYLADARAYLYLWREADKGPVNRKLSTANPNSITQHRKRVAFCHLTLNFAQTSNME